MNDLSPSLHRMAAAVHYGTAEKCLKLLAWASHTEPLCSHPTGIERPAGGYADHEDNQ